MIDVGDPVEVWSGLGFVLDGRLCRVGGIVFRLEAPGGGVTGWGLAGAPDLLELPLADLGEGPTQPTVDRRQAGQRFDHPNGARALDHVVVATPDLDRTIEAFEGAGVALRRTRKAGSPAEPLMQAFFKLGEVVVEVVGPPRPSAAGPATFYGLAFTVDDLDATARLLGDRLRPARDAVQPGRRIATVDRVAGSTVPIAFMSPPPPREGAPSAVSG